MKPTVTTEEQKDPQAKDKFKSLSEEFKDACAAADENELRKRLATIAGDEEKLEAAKETDTDLITKKEAYDAANKPYKDSFKEYKLQRKFIVRCLVDQGKL